MMGLRKNHAARCARLTVHAVSREREEEEKEKQKQREKKDKKKEKKRERDRLHLLSALGQVLSSATTKCTNFYKVEFCRKVRHEKTFRRLRLLSYHASRSENT
ncbi:hypothetical protein PUN28_012018 [Cardiocondyla obscurior]|uniref:Uncharacterized protein n=1 Tax=Cardiocondyla obscurior TaxID=286306 RepID=A0AAW2FBM0_9HYME